MKVRFMFYALVALCGAALSGCSSDDDGLLQKDVAEDVEEVIECGTTPSTMGISEIEGYSDLYSTFHSEFFIESLESEEGIGFCGVDISKFKRQGDSYKYTGYSSDPKARAHIILKDGKIYTPVYNPNAYCWYISVPWEYYCEYSGCEDKIYVGNDPELNMDKRSVDIRGGQNRIIMCTRLNLAIAHKDGEWNPRERSILVIDYERNDDIVTPHNLYFDSEMEAVRYMLDTCWDYFGRYIPVTYFNEFEERWITGHIDLEDYESHYEGMYIIPDPKEGVEEFEW